MESIGDGLDGIMMGGSVSEASKESNEQFAARVAAAQARVAKVRRDEKISRNFDIILSKILPNVSQELLNFIIFLIDHEIPSLTILAIISLNNDEAGKVCWKEFKKYIAERADFSNINLPAVTEEKISYWWTFIFAADYSSKTTTLKELKHNEKFTKKLTKGLSVLLRNHFVINKINNFDLKRLKIVLKKYEKLIFGDK